MPQCTRERESHKGDLLSDIVCIVQKEEGPAAEAASVCQRLSHVYEPELIDLASET